MGFEVPAALLDSPVLRDAAGRQWLTALPSRVERAFREWGLGADPAGEVRHGAHAVVVPVIVDGAAAVLRVARADPMAVEALRVWEGRGAVRLVRADGSAEVVLLERLDASRSLVELPVRQAAGLAGEVVRRLAVPARDFPRTAHEAARWVSNLQVLARAVVPEPWVQVALACARDLASSRTEFLVHADLTRENVLHRGAGEFVAIDPRPMLGDPERSAPEFLLRSVDDTPPGDLPAVLAEFVRAGDLDLERAHRWVVARTVDYWTWAAGTGLTEDPLRCRRILEEFLGPV